MAHRRPDPSWLALAVVAAALSAGLVWAIGRDMTGDWGGRVMVLGGFVVITRWAEAAWRKAWRRQAIGGVQPLGTVHWPTSDDRR